MHCKSSIKLTQWIAEAGESKFLSEYKKLTNLRLQYVHIGNERHDEYQKLQSNIKEKQRFRFLNRFFISDYNIPKIGPSRKLTLASYGIETAADVSKQKILSINGFGQSYLSELIKWQTELMKGFVFNPKGGIDAADINELECRLSKKQKNIETGLILGIELLNQSSNEVFNKRKELHPIVVEAAKRLAQAQANFKVLG
jgi:DNA-binding helix-hairpin-helix protein with protein kinase domain